MTNAAGGTGKASNPMVSVQNNTAPTTPEAIAAYQVERAAEARDQAAAAVESALRKVERQEQHLAAATTEAKADRARAHLAAAEEALAQALAEQKGLA